MTILPVKQDLKVKAALKAASVSPMMAKIHGSKSTNSANFHFANGGMSVGMKVYIFLAQI